MQSTAVIASMTRNLDQKKHIMPDTKTINLIKNASARYIENRKRSGSCSDFNNGLITAESLEIAPFYDFLILKGKPYIIQRTQWLANYNYEQKDKTKKVVLGVMVGWDLEGKQFAIKIKFPNDHHKELSVIKASEAKTAETKDTTHLIKVVEEAIGKAQNHTIICGKLSWHQEFELDASEDGFPVTISEWVDGVSLKKYLKMGSPKSIAESLNFAEKLFEAIALLHKAGLAHLDLHAGNVMLILKNKNIEKIILIDGDNGQQIEGTLNSHKIDGRIGKDTIRSWRDITHLETKAYVGAKSDIYAAGLLLQEFIGMRSYDLNIAQAIAEVTDFIWKKRNEIRKESKTADKELEIKDYDTLIQPIHDFLSELKLYDIAEKLNSDIQNNSYEKIQQVLNSLAFSMVKQKPHVLSQQYPNDIQSFINTFRTRDANELTLTAEKVLQIIKDLKKKHHKIRVPLDVISENKATENNEPVSATTGLDDDEQLPQHSVVLSRSVTTSS